MEISANLFFIIISIIAALIVLFLHLKRWSKKIKVNLSSEQGIQKFIELLFIYDQKKVFLTIDLSPKFITEFKTHLTLTLPQIYNAYNISGGFLVMFDQAKKEDIFSKRFIEPNRIKGNFKILHQPKPELGWFTIQIQ
jgi:hypothetical protein